MNTEAARARIRKRAGCFLLRFSSSAWKILSTHPGCILYTVGRQVLHHVPEGHVSSLQGSEIECCNDEGICQAAGTRWKTPDGPGRVVVPLVRGIPEGVTGKPPSFSPGPERISQPARKNSPMDQWVKDMVGLGVFLWIPGYIASILLFFSPYALLTGWIITPVFTPVAVAITW